MTLHFIRLFDGTCRFCQKTGIVGEFRSDMDANGSCRIVYCCEECYRKRSGSSAPFSSPAPTSPQPAAVYAPAPMPPQYAPMPPQPAAVYAPAPTSPQYAPMPPQPVVYVPIPASEYYEEGNGHKKLIITIISLLVIAALAVTLFFTVFSSNAIAKRKVNAFFSAMNSRSESQLVDLQFPPAVQDDLNRESLICGFREEFKGFDAEFGSDWKIKNIKIESIRDVDPEDAGIDVDHVEDTYNIKITKVKKVKVSADCMGSEDGDHGDLTLFVYKADGKWYVHYDW